LCYDQSIGWKEGKETMFSTLFVILASITPIQDDFHLVVTSRPEVNHDHAPMALRPNLTPKPTTLSIDYASDLTRLVNAR